LGRSAKWCLSPFSIGPLSDPGLLPTIRGLEVPAVLMLDVARLCEEVADSELFQAVGRVHSAAGLLWSCHLRAAVGDQCEVLTPRGPVRAEVIGFTRGLTHVVPYETVSEVQPGLAVVRTTAGLRAPVGDELLGRVLDGLGRPLDGRGPLERCEYRPVRQQVPPALGRSRIRMPFVTGQRVIDGLLTCGWGQRVGIFSGSGVGKSTLLGEIARGSNADVNVIALIGERGREVVPFLEDCVGEHGLTRSVVLVATCDQTPLMRVRAVQVALTIGDYYRDAGANVLLMVDSLTRLAVAQRELGLALGEPPSVRGYTPSVFQLLANVVEAMGNAEHGTLTGLLTVLVDGGDMDEPIADAVRSLVDGHIVLDRRLAERGHYPAVNVGVSLSRVANDVVTPAHAAAARKLRAIQATYDEAEDLLRIGAYVKGSSPQLDRAVELRPALLTLLRQNVGEATALADTVAGMERIAAAWPY
jgi:flagellum-specific ATP synthase